MNENPIYGLKPLEFIKLALAEDSGNGDHTSLSTIDKDKSGKAHVKVKENGIIAGIEIAKLILQCVDEHLQSQVYTSDGSNVIAGEEVMTIEGNIRNLLRAE